jgi:hypothetical protein
MRPETQNSEFLENDSEDLEYIPAIYGGHLPGNQSVSWEWEKEIE